MIPGKVKIYYCNYLVNRIYMAISNSNYYRQLKKDILLKEISF
uniref:Uncharacterized protein n=1 Tax=uncultured Desulfobacterium sp. TaxID=201089 RepID=E1YLI6_9BACT|nr:unknown protein [uncultured Desulfobacterium sp.]